jgi:hypothetical protein
MKPDYPECPNVGLRCLFQGTGGSNTLMYSPISYDRTGKAVSGGCNSFTMGIKCVTCGMHWHSKQTELEDAQGVKRQWEESK